MKTTFKQVLSQTREAAVVSAWERAAKANSFAKAALTWAGRGAAYRAKASAMGVAIISMPAAVQIGDVSPDRPGIVGVSIPGLPGLHVAIENLAPAARAIVERRMQKGARRRIASRMVCGRRRPG